MSATPPAPTAQLDPRRVPPSRSELETSAFLSPSRLNTLNAAPHTTSVREAALGVPHLDSLPTSELSQEPGAPRCLTHVVPPWPLALGAHPRGQGRQTPLRSPWERQVVPAHRVPGTLTLA